ncbi:MAG: trypsin-like peptidase domain-containing protein [Chthoniobacterales bacterium]
MLRFIFSTFVITRCAILFLGSLFVANLLRAQQGSPPNPATSSQQQHPSVPAAPVTVAVPVPVGPMQPNGKIQKSLVRITATEVEPDYRAPWNSGAIQRGIGAGFVIDRNRIMTNAHVVSNSRYLTVERDGDPNKYSATVLFVAHDCDLAVITVSEAAFFKNMIPLKFGGLPELESTVSAYGYPIGGQRMSVTAGIVSRVDFQVYTHSSIDSHLAIQISAQINPGNSGGPVMQNGKVVGVAFQGYSGDVAQGVAYMIPTPVVQRFLKDIQDNHYDKYVDLGITYSRLQNPAQRHFLGLKDDDRGVLVNTVIAAGAASKVVQPGDVLLAVDDHPIASDSFVELEGERVEMPEVVERKFKGDSVKLDLLRDKKPLTVKVELGTIWPYLQQGHGYDMRPRYVVYAGLLFQPLSLDLVDAYQPNDFRLRHYFDRFVTDAIYLEHPEVIVLTNILPDPINSYLTTYRAAIVDEVNGTKIRTLDDLAKAFAQTTDRFVIRMIGDGPPLVLDPKEVAAARERIKTRYNVVTEQNLDNQPVAKLPENSP